MTITKKELLQAFREAASMEFEDIPRDNSQIQHIFSEDFEDRMNHLLKKETEKIERSAHRHTEYIDC